MHLVERQWFNNLKYKSKVKRLLYKRGYGDLHVLDHIGSI